MSVTERKEKAHSLLTKMDTTPAFIFDLVDYKLFGEYRLHPLLVEQLLIRRRQFEGNTSLRDNVAKYYGEETSNLMESLI